MYIEANKLSTCVSISCTNVCTERVGQVVYVINVPWYNLFITDMPVQNGYADYAEVTKCTEVVPYLTRAVDRSHQIVGRVRLSI